MAQIQSMDELAAGRPLYTRDNEGLLYRVWVGGGVTRNQSVAQAES